MLRFPTRFARIPPRRRTNFSPPARLTLTHCVVRADVVLVEATFVVPRFVRITRLGVDAAVDFDVEKGELHHPSVASEVQIIARTIDEILFGQRNQLGRFGEMLSFQRARGGERPTGTALALVFDRSDVTFAAPIFSTNDEKRE